MLIDYIWAIKNISIMKRAVLFLVFVLTCQGYAQSINYVSPLSQTAISDATRILPNGVITNPAYDYLAPYTGVKQEGCYLITPAEMQAAGFVAGDELTSLSWTLTQGQMAETNGLLKIYLMNTSHTTNSIFTTGMEFFNSTITIPNQAGSLQFDFSNAFIYSGQGLYVTFEFTPNDYSSWTSLLQTGVNTNLQGGFREIYVLGGDFLGEIVSNIHSKRPVTVFGKNNCTKTNFVFTDHTDISATITWQGQGTYEIEYGLYPYEQGTGGITLPLIVSTTENNTYTFTDLIPGKSYTAFMRKICSPSDFSGWSSNNIGTSITGAVTSLPYTENFNNSFLFNYGWHNLIGGHQNWNNWITHDPYSPYDGQIGLADSQATENDKTVYSRPIQLFTGNTYTLNFEYNNWWILEDFYPDSANFGDLNILLASSLTSENATLLSSINTITNSQNLLKTIQITVPATGIYYIGFNIVFPPNPTQDPELIGHTRFNILSIDNFKIEQTLGIDKNITTAFSIFPNPTTDILNFSEPLNNIVVYDLTGRRIQSSTGNQDKIDVSILAKGNYLIDGQNDSGERMTMKFIKL